MARSQGQRSRPGAAKEHRRTDAGLLAGGRPVDRGETLAVGGKGARVQGASGLPPLAAVIGALALLAAASGWLLLAGRSVTPSAPAHLSIVVLPFANLAGDPTQDYFADGITENLTANLSRLSGSFVIARNTAFTFKGKNVDAKEIGKELGVGYVLEGSVQRDQNQVRVNAQTAGLSQDGCRRRSPLAAAASHEWRRGTPHIALGLPRLALMDGNSGRR